MRLWLKLLAILAALIVSAVTTNAGEEPAAWGSILGRITFDGDEAPLRVVPMPGPQPREALPAGVPIPMHVVEDSLLVGENRGIANAFVYLRSKPSRVHPAAAAVPPRKQELTAGLLRFEPHALFVRSGDTLVMKNAGNQPLNIKTHGNSEFNMVVPMDNSREWTLKAADSMPRPLDSNILPWIKAWMLVRDDTYGSITNERGLFVIANLPRNEPLELQLWHERAGYLRNITSTTGHKTSAVGQLKITLTDAVTDLGEFRVPSELFKE